MTNCSGTTRAAQDRVILISDSDVGLASCPNTNKKPCLIKGAIQRRAVQYYSALEQAGQKAYNVSSAGLQQIVAQLEKKGNFPPNPQKDFMNTSKSKMKVRKKSSAFWCMTKLKVFILALFFAYLAKTMSGAYMSSILTQIERRFNIPASLVGVISGSFEMGNLLLMAFVSYLGTKLHRPRMIALGCAVMALGCFLMGLPHFLMGRYDYGSTVAVSENSSSGMAVCLAHQSQFSMPTEQPSEECEKQTESLMWVFVLVGNLIRGIGETPIAPLGISYVEDFAKAENSPFYIGCLQIATVLGPLFGLMVASYSAELFVDVGSMNLEDVTLNLTDARWVGAWWLGILICAMVNLLVAVPFCFLPKSLPKEGEENRAELSIKGNKTLLQTERALSAKEKISEITKDFIPYLKSLFHNRIYVLFLCITVVQFNADIGMVTFLPKYLEQQFGISASDAIFLMAVYNLPVICVGYFFGGLMMKKFKMSTYKAAHLGFWSYFIQYLLYLSAFFMICKSASVAGLTVSYEGIDQVFYEETSLYADCNRGCGCSTKVWDPVCGENGITYVSACLAGCDVSNGTGKNIIFENCSCISASGYSSGNGSAALGQCEREGNCHPMLHYYLILCLICCLIYSFGAMPGYMVLIRSLKPEEKSFGVGLHTLTERAFAGIPSPIYFGAMIDTTCLKWGTKRCGGEGACRMYNADTYRWLYLGVPPVLHGLSFILCVFVLLILKKQRKDMIGENTEMEAKDEEIELAEQKDTSEAQHSAKLYPETTDCVNMELNND